MPGTSAIAHLTMSALGVTTGLVLPTLLMVHTSCTSIAPMSTQPTASTVTSASPYAASLLPK